MNALLTPHVKAQALRFIRATGYAFLAAFLATGGHLRWWDLLSLLAGAAETGLRQVFPVNPVPQVSAVLADPSPPAKG